MDWSNEIYTASEDDKQPLNYHPVYGLSQTAVWNDSLHFCATEAAPVYGGFIEGALEAADNSLSRIMAKAA